MGSSQKSGSHWLSDRVARGSWLRNINNVTSSLPFYHSMVVACSGSQS